MQTQALSRYLREAPLFHQALGPNWSFVAFEDAGEGRTGTFRCHCGRPLRFRITLRFTGDLSELPVPLSEDEKLQIIDNHREIYFGETCFNHKILGLTSDVAQHLTDHFRRLHQALKQIRNNPALMHLLLAQKHLVESLSAAGADLPPLWRLRLDSGLTLSEKDAEHLIHIKDNFRKQQILRPDNWIPTPPQGRPTAPLARITGDSLFAENLKMFCDQIQPESRVSVQSMTWKLDAVHPTSYGYTPSGLPAFYPKLVTFVRSQAALGRLTIISSKANDLIFSKNNRSNPKQAKTG